jgi:hypothetical protein
MGFTDRSCNKKLLEQSGNDVATVVDRLRREASTAQRRENEGGRGSAGESAEDQGMGGGGVFRLTHSTSSWARPGGGRGGDGGASSSNGAGVYSGIL